MERKIIFFLPIVICLAITLLGISEPILLSLFLMFWMVIWWVFEIMPLGITSLIPMVFVPSFGLMTLKDVTAQYANPVIYLFLGGFIIARALEKTMLSERIALLILKYTGKSDKGIILGFITATAFLSMWISNTATTVMMVPIGISVISFLRTNLQDDEKSSLKSMEIAMFLSIAYSANIGGIMTPIGTPPNVVFVGYLDELFSMKIEFFHWLLFATPTALVIMFIMYKLLNFLFPYNVPVGKDFQNYVSKQIKLLGKISIDQKITLIVFVFTASLWIFKGAIHFLAGRDIFTDTSIAILGGILLFLIPKNRKEWKPVLDNSDISHLPWNIVLLFGGGMALANVLKVVGIIQICTDYFGTLDLGSIYWLVFVLALLTLFLTEVMSNVALCVVALPVIMNLGAAQDISPIIMALPAALCSSFAFSMPISTPPNAIVFGTNRIKVIHMLKAGIILNIFSVIIVMTVTWYLMKIIF